MPQQPDIRVHRSVIVTTPAAVYLGITGPLAYGWPAEWTAGGCAVLVAVPVVASTVGNRRRKKK